MPLTPIGAIGRIVLINASAFALVIAAMWMGLPKSAVATSAASLQMLPVFYFMVVRKKRPEWVSMLFGAYGLCYGSVLAAIAVFVPVLAVVDGITVPNARAYIAIISGLFTAGLILIIIGTWVISREHARGTANSDAHAFN